MATAAVESDASGTYHRLLNLSVVLAETRPNVVELEDEELRACGEEEVRRYYESDGAEVPIAVIERRCKQAGGGRAVMRDAKAIGLEDMAERSALNSHEDAARDYRRHVFATGIPFREDGLFPIDDGLLTSLSLDSTLKPFQKAIPGPGRGKFITCESWAVGNQAAQRGLDLRYFYDEATAKSGYPELVAVARVGEGGSIGVSTWPLAHGGCIETILDETTAELVKCFCAPCCVTVELSAKIKKPLPLHTTVKVHVQIKSVQSNGLRIFTIATMTNAKDEILATCEAQLCDAGMLNRMQARG